MTIIELIKDNLYLDHYKKGLIVCGPATKTYKDTLKALGGTYSPKIIFNAFSGTCWVFSTKRLNDIKKAFNLPIQEEISEETIDSENSIAIGQGLHIISYMGNQLVYGNTYPYRQIFKELGASWKGLKLLKGEKGCCWVINNPDSKSVAETLTRLIERATPPTPIPIPTNSPIPTSSIPATLREQIAKLGFQRILLILDSTQSLNPLRIEALAQLKTIMPDTLIENKSMRLQIVKDALEISKSSQFIRQNLVEQLSALGHDNLRLILDFDQKENPTRIELLKSVKTIMPETMIQNKLERIKIIKEALDLSQIDF